jgi:hypothetical protein
MHHKLAFFLFLGTYHGHQPEKRKNEILELSTSWQENPEIKSEKQSLERNLGMKNIRQGKNGITSTGSTLARSHRSLILPCRCKDYGDRGTSC